MKRIVNVVESDDECRGEGEETRLGRAEDRVDEFSCVCLCACVCSVQQSVPFHTGEGPHADKHFLLSQFHSEWVQIVNWFCVSVFVFLQVLVLVKLNNSVLTSADKPNQTVLLF